MPDLVVNRLTSTGPRSMASPVLDCGEFWPGWIATMHREASAEAEDFAEAAILYSQSLVPFYRELTSRLVNVAYGMGSVSCARGTVQVHLLPWKPVPLRERAPVFRAATYRKRTDTLQELGASGIVIPNAAAVRSYLDRFADLARLLPAICDRTRDEFASQAELSLELYRDPEIADEYLTVCVRLPRYEDDTMDRIECVNQFFEDRLTPSSGYLLVTTDFRPPARGRNGV